MVSAGLDVLSATSTCCSGAAFRLWAAAGWLVLSAMSTSCCKSGADQGGPVQSIMSVVASCHCCCCCSWRSTVC